MLTKLIDKEILALARLVRSDDGKVLVGYINRALQDVKDRVITLEPESMIRRFQGRADALQYIVEALESAPDLVVKMEHRANGR